MSFFPTIFFAIDEIGGGCNSGHALRLLSSAVTGLSGGAALAARRDGSTASPRPVAPLSPLLMLGHQALMKLEVRQPAPLPVLALAVPGIIALAEP